MAIVRCQKHNIPYNDANPRGCPACYQDEQGGGDAAVMRELARASRAISQPDPVTAEPSLPNWAPVTQPPRLPTPEPGAVEKLREWIKQHRGTAISGTAFLIVAIMAYSLLRPSFIEGIDPPVPAEAALPLPVQPNVPVEGMFAMLGVQPPGVSPLGPRWARYRYGSATIDAMNAVVWGITLDEPDRAWSGLRVGVHETPIRGALTLLGPVREPTTEEPPSPFPMGRWMVYRSAHERPARTLRAEVRPPNGCYDVEVTLSPRIFGTVRKSEFQYAAVARRGGNPEWVATRIRVVSRAMAGPDGPAAAC